MLGEARRAGQLKRFSVIRVLKGKLCAVCLRGPVLETTAHLSWRYKLFVQFKLHLMLLQLTASSYAGA